MRARRVVRWLVAAAALVLVLGAVALAGGFAEADPAAGRSVPAGETIRLARMTAVVQRARLVDTDEYGSEQDPKLQVDLTVTLTSDTSLSGLPYAMVRLRADGRLLPVGYDEYVNGWSDALDPDRPRQVRYVVDWKSADPPSSLQVVVFDETASYGYASSTPDWGVDTSAAAASVTVPVQDARR